VSDDGCIRCASERLHVQLDRLSKSWSWCSLMTSSGRWISDCTATVALLAASNFALARVSIISRTKFDRATQSVSFVEMSTFKISLVLRCLQNAKRKKCETGAFYDPFTTLIRSSGALVAREVKSQVITFLYAFTSSFLFFEIKFPATCGFRLVLTYKEFYVGVVICKTWTPLSSSSGAIWFKIPQ
jgi:hypothetical protein